MSAATIPAVLALALALTGCGLKGPLFLPEKAGPVTTRPTTTAPAGGSAAAPATVPGAEPAPATQAPATPSETPPPIPPAAGDKTGG